jgi:hypothetical protein
LIQKNAKLTISERTLIVKLNLANEQIAAERKSFASREESLRSAFQTKHDTAVGDLAAQLQQFRCLLQTVARRLFGKLIPESSAFSDVAEFINKELENCTSAPEARILGEVLELRGRFGDVSLISLVEQLQNAKSDLLQQVGHLVKDKAELTRECLVLSEQNKEMEKWRRISVQWFQWGVSLLGQFVSGPIAQNDHSELRNRLEDLLLNAASRGGAVKKITMLRAEKALMLTCQGIAVSRRGVLPILSIRPLLLVVVFGNRVRGM